MKLEDIPQEFKDKAEFACKVCRAFFNSTHTNKKIECSCRSVLKEYCPYIDEVLEKEMALRSDEVCVSCGKGYAVEGSLICPNCISDSKT